MLEERFNDSSLKDTSPPPSKLVKAIEQNVMKSAKTFTGVQKQLQGELEKLNKELTATADKYKVEALATEKAFNSTIELKDKEHDAKVKDLESKTDQAVQDATKTLQAELAEYAP
jgi:Skp family chaperone for outer membrane proteins